MNVYVLLVCLLTFVSQIGAETDGIKEKPKKIALIFGASGQDGTYLTEFLLGKNYEVHSVSRKNPTSQGTPYFFNTDLILHSGNISNSASVIKLIQTIQPDEIYNLAAQSSVNTSFESPLETAETNALGTLHILEAIKSLQPYKSIKFFQAASSELFEQTKGLQNENTNFHPRSPYGISKLYSYWITVNYREAYGIFGCNGILFNHESPIRPDFFISRKITLAACSYKLGTQEMLYIGNLDACRDWGYAKDYVEAMWLMLQQDAPDDYILATGESHSVREFVTAAYKEVGVDVEWHGSGLNEYGIDTSNGKIIIMVDPKFYRPCDSKLAQGDASKALKCLNWAPKTTFQGLVKIMIESDYNKKLSE